MPAVTLEDLREESQLFSSVGRQLAEQPSAPRGVASRQSMWARVAAMVRAGVDHQAPGYLSEVPLAAQDRSEARLKSSDPKKAQPSATLSVMRDAGAGLAHVLTPEGRRSMGAAVSGWVERVPVVRAAVSAVSSTVNLLVAALAPRNRADALTVNFRPGDSSPRVELCAQACGAALQRDVSNLIDAATKGVGAEELSKRLAQAVVEALNSMGSGREREEHAERNAAEARQEREREELVRVLAETLEQIDALSGHSNGVTPELLRRLWSSPYLPDVGQMLAIARQAEAAEIAEIARLVREAVAGVMERSRPQVRPDADRTRQPNGGLASWASAA